MGGIKFFTPLALVLSFVLSTFADRITYLDTFSTLETFIDCHDRHIVPEGFYTVGTYNAAQPTSSEITEWTTVVNELSPMAARRAPMFQKLVPAMPFATWAKLFVVHSSWGEYLRRRDSGVQTRTGYLCNSCQSCQRSPVTDANTV